MLNVETNKAKQEWSLQFCTADETRQFVKTVVEQKLARNEGGKRLMQQMVYWKKAYQLLSQMALPPAVWWKNSEIIVAAAVTGKVHPNYYVKALTLINEFGDFLTDARGLPTYKRVGFRAYDRSRLAAAYGEDRLSNRVSQPLSPQILQRHKSEFQEPHYNFLAICLAFGLRPSELDRMKTDPTSYRVGKEPTYTYLEVCQQKLKGIAKDKRWKRIPVHETAQRRLLPVLLSGEWKRPRASAVKKILGREFGLYSGRKEFAAQMIQKGWRFEDASKMLGHLNVRTTEQYYIDPAKLLADRTLNALEHRKSKTKQKGEE